MRKVLASCAMFVFVLGLVWGMVAIPCEQARATYCVSTEGIHYVDYDDDITCGETRRPLYSCQGLWDGTGIPCNCEFVSCVPADFGPKDPGPLDP